MPQRWCWRLSSVCRFMLVDYVTNCSGILQRCALRQRRKDRFFALCCSQCHLLYNATSLNKQSGLREVNIPSPIAMNSQILRYYRSHRWCRHCVIPVADVMWRQQWVAKRNVTKWCILSSHCARLENIGLDACANQQIQPLRDHKSWVTHGNNDEFQGIKFACQLLFYDISLPHSRHGLTRSPTFPIWVVAQTRFFKRVIPTSTASVCSPSSVWISAFNKNTKTLS